MKKVITYGTFDLFHEGHYKLLQRAKELGDYLIVGVTTESYDHVRGKLNIVDSMSERIENVRKSGFADKIIIEESYGQKVTDIKKHGVDIFTVGSDWVGVFDYIEDYCEVVYLERTKDISSTILREKNKKIQQIGIIGSGRIANRFIPEAKLVSGINVNSVYNKNKESAKGFAEKWNVNYYTDLEKFFQENDSVYIATPHETHYEYIKLALEHGKNVLCEKPMVLEKSQAEELHKYAKDKKLILLEAIKTAYSPAFEKLIGMVCSGAIGSIRYIDASFTKLEDDSTRELTDKKYGGSLIELGSYCLLPIIKLLGEDYENIDFQSLYNKNGLDIFTKVTLKYKNAIATINCGLGVKSEGKLIIGGTKGYIVVDSPWWKTAYFEIHHGNNTSVEKYAEIFLGDGLRYEIRDFVNLINGDDKNQFKLTSNETIAIATILEKFISKENR